MLDPTEYLGTYRSPLLDAELTTSDDGRSSATTSRGGSRRRIASDAEPAAGPGGFFERDRLFVPEGPGKGTEAEFFRGPRAHRVVPFRRARDAAAPLTELSTALPPGRR